MSQRPRRRRRHARRRFHARPAPLDMTRREQQGSRLLAMLANVSRQMSAIEASEGPTIDINTGHAVTPGSVGFRRPSLPHRESHSQRSWSTHSLLNGPSDIVMGATRRAVLPPDRSAQHLSASVPSLGPAWDTPTLLMEVRRQKMPAFPLLRVTKCLCPGHCLARANAAATSRKQLRSTTPKSRRSATARPGALSCVVNFVPCAHNSVGLCRAAEAPEFAATGNVPTGYGDHGRSKYPA